ncbi:MAG: Ig-like domain-containing protein [Steroidobacteraceae bacterium]
MSIRFLERAFAALVLLMLTGGAYGAELLSDINTVVISRSSNPRYIGTAGAQAIFVAGSGSAAVDAGLWASDGTAAGTQRLLPAGALTFDNPQALVSLGTRTMWTGRRVNTPTPQPSELWVSDGTAAGTFKLAEFDASTVGHVATLPSGAAVFGVRTSTNTELWRSDGSVAGTWRLAQFDSPANTVLPQGAAIDNLLYFSAQTALGNELWVTDASNVAANTHLEIDLEPGAGSSTPKDITAVGSDLYFTATVGNSGIGQLWRRDASGQFQQPSPVSATIECASDTLLYFISDGQPWRSDGTAAGTFALLPSQHSDSIDNCVVAGTRVFLRLISGSASSLWQSDGTVNGTTAVPIGAGLTVPLPLFWTGNHLFFNAADPITGVELYVTDGSPAGTHLVMDAFAGANGGSSSVQKAGSQLFAFTMANTYNAEKLIQLWRMDLDGSHPVHLTDDISVEPYSVSPPYTTIANSRAFFTSQNPARGAEPAASDGTVAGTLILKDIAPETQNLGSQPDPFVSFGSDALFWADDGIHGRTLWRTDGSTAGTRRVQDASPGEGAANGRVLGVFDGIAYLQASDRTHGQELWKTDGTATGTQRLTDLEPGTGNGIPSGLCNTALKLGSFVYFQGSTTVTGAELWRTDGTSTGVALLADVAPDAASSLACPVAVLGTRLYFTTMVLRGQELWSTDGTLAGTHFVAALQPAAAAGYISVNTVFHGEFIFATRSSLSTSPRQIWRTNDNTPTLVFDATPLTGSSIAWMIATEDALYFAVTGNTAPGIYKWNGGADIPTRMVTDVTVSAGVAFRLEEKIAFKGSTAGDGCEWFATDGTAAGTAPITNFSASGECTASSVAARFGQTLYFGVVIDGTTQLARTGSTLADAQMLTSFTGPVRGVASTLGMAGGQVIFGVNDGGLIGAELFVQRNQVPRALDDAATTTVGQSVEIALLANDSDTDGRMLASTLRIVAQPVNGSIVVAASGVTTYRPNANFVGTDSFRYAVTDNAGAESSPATVSIAVSAVTDAPTNPPAPAPPTNQGNKGGGGSTGVLTLLALIAIYAVRRTSRVNANSVLPRH